MKPLEEHVWSMDRLHDEIVQNKVKFRPKRSWWLMHVLRVILFFVPKFMTGFWTTIARTVTHPGGLPEGGYDWAWLEDHKGIVTHEVKHVKQWVRWWLWQPITYIFGPLPVGFCYGRYVWERGPYLGDILAGRTTVERVVELLGGASYGWCMPKFIIRRWLQKQLALYDTCRRRKHEPLSPV